MKVLNLYAGIGGNRKLWTKENTGLDLQITAVELDPNIAKIYKDFFPDDEVIVGDAHQYLLDHYKEFDFIWASPPCPTHSRLRYAQKNKWKPRYPDMRLYQEIIFLNGFFGGKWVIENVISWYDPLIRPNEIGRHYYWANFFILPFKGKKQIIANKPTGQNTYNYRASLVNTEIKNFYEYDGDKRTLIANMVEPEISLHIFNSMNNQELKLNL